MSCLFWQYPARHRHRKPMDEIKKNYGRIYDEHVDRIYRFVFLRVNSQETAEDLTSETFLKGWEVFRSDCGKIKNPQAFLYRIAKNLVIDHYRSKGRVQVVSSDEHDYRLADPKANLEKTAALSSDMESIKKALSGLNEDYQNAIIWHYLDDLPMKEVAELLDRSEPAARVLLHRAMKELKTRLN